ncbi:tetratricopeptide repeat protein [bacterium]|nr:tetratricopeptide repeat protein [bacterium]
MKITISRKLLLVLAAGVAVLAGYFYVDMRREQNFLRSKEPLLSDTTQARLWFEEGVSLTEKSRYDSSLIFFERATGIYQRDSVWRFYIDGMNYIGDNFRRLGRYDTAFSILTANIDRSIRYLGETDVSTAMAINKMGLWYMDQGDDEKAKNNFNKALWIRKKTLPGDHIDIGWSYNNLGLVNYNSGYFTLALQYYDQALGVFMRTIGENSSPVAVLNNNMASVYQAQGNHEKALEHINRSLQIRKTLFGSDHVTLSENYTLMGTAYLRKGEMNQAFKLYNQALSVNERKYGLGHPTVGNNYYNLGFAFKEVGQMDTALSYYRYALNNWKKNYGLKHPVIARVSDEIGELFLEKNMYDSALFYFNNALTIWNNRPGAKGFRRAHEYSHIGMTYLKMGDVKKSLTYYEQALSINLEYYGSKHLEVSLCYSNMAGAHRIVKDYPAALRNIQKAIDALLIADSASGFMYRTRDAVKLMLALELKGDILQEYYEYKTQNLQHLKASFASYAMAVEWLDRTRREYVSEDSKILIGQRSIGLFEKAIQTATDLYKITSEKKYLNEAFIYSETSKAAVLSEVVSRQHAKRFVGIPDSLLEYEEQLRNRIGVYNKKLFSEQNSGGYGSPKFRYIQDQLFQLTSEYEAYLKHVEQTFPQLYSLKYKPLIMPLEAVQKLIPDSTVLLEYFIGNRHLYAFCVTRSGCAWAAAPVDSSLIGVVHALTTGIQTMNMALYSTSAHYLYNVVFKPFEKTSAVKLIVVPDGILSGIPFEALLPRLPDNQEDYATLNYLIKKYHISYAYSASLLFQPSSVSRDGLNDLAGFTSTTFK